MPKQEEEEKKEGEVEVEEKKEEGEVEVEEKKEEEVKQEEKEIDKKEEVEVKQEEAKVEEEAKKEEEAKVEEEPPAPQPTETSRTAWFLSLYIATDRELPPNNQSTATEMLLPVFPLLPPQL